MEPIAAIDQVYRRATRIAAMTATEGRMYMETIIAREKQRDLQRQVEQDRLLRLARAAHKTRTKAGPRAWDRLTCWLCQLRLNWRADLCSRIGAAGQYLFNAFYWTGRE